MSDTPAPSPATNTGAPLRMDELRRPEAFPHPVNDLQVRETHISWVVLTGERAYKIKKPVKLDFIDASTLSQRLHHCNEELRLNRRLAPDLYREVVPIARIDGGVRVGDTSSPPIEYAVCMRQFDTTQELAELLRHDRVSREQAEALGESIGRFHEQAAQAAPHDEKDEENENTEHMYDAVLRNLEDLRKRASQLDSPEDLQRLIDWTHATARSLESRFHDRERHGFVRECHGDLHSGNIVLWRDALVPFDCIDFNPELRWIDVINDVAFLVMDLKSRGRADLAAVLLNKYLETTADYDGMALLPFYAVYRALVRAKVDAIGAEQSPEHAAEYHERLQRRIRAALQWTSPPRGALILMQGVSGSGKSWLSEKLQAALPALRVRSDLERKRLAGVSENKSAASAPDTGIYTPHMSHRTYARLLECAESCLQTGFHTIVDAAFLDKADRELFRGLAARLNVPLVIVSCKADADTLSERVRGRKAAGKDASDADQAVLESQLRKLQPFDAAETPRVIEVDTRQPADVEGLAEAIRTRL